MTRFYVSGTGREYRVLQVMECQECLARLDDDLAVAVHDAWHARRIPASWPTARAGRPREATP